MWASNGEDFHKISNKVQVFCYMTPCKKLEPNCHSCQAEFCIRNRFKIYSQQPVQLEIGLPAYSRAVLKQISIANLNMRS